VIKGYVKFSFLLVYVAFSASANIKPFVFYTAEGNCAATFVSRSAVIISSDCKDQFSRKELYLKSFNGAEVEVKPREIASVANSSFVLVKFAKQILSRSSFPKLAQASSSDKLFSLSVDSERNISSFQVDKQDLSNDGNQIKLEQSKLIIDGSQLSSSQISPFIGLPLYSIESDTILIHGLSYEQSVNEDFIINLSRSNNESIQVDYKEFLGHLESSSLITEMEVDELMMEFVSPQADLDYFLTWLDDQGVYSTDLKRIYQKRILTFYHR